MSELAHRLLGKIVIVSFLRPEVTPLKGTLAAVDDHWVVVEHLKGTRMEPVYIPLTAIMQLIEHAES